MKLTARDTIILKYENEDGDEVEIEVPGKYEVCDNCNGHGKTTNPAIDGNGITSSEWAEWDDDEKENYLSGKYDIRCEECKGMRVVAVVDTDHIEQWDKELSLQYQEYLHEGSRRRIERYRCLREY